ncbi:SRPBCC family protein [Azospira restricta]|uniref:DUF1857 family protein n=1 Tax=Azospira restricta TaxID=404405 RepID=A0A974SQ80_9RHOO|nr:SRPBCC family protein [Azospira restricta]QRJ64374.1 DUF1857 family protein [Azospira restricta]
MKFEHLVEINDPRNPMIPLLTRDQLWQGLMFRAEDATHFLPGLDACVILERGDCMLQRRLDFGQAAIEDRVTWSRYEWMRFEVAATGSHAGGTLTITIEEPEEDHLFLRFAYATTLGESADDADAAYAEFVKAAYHESDIDTVRVIRTLLAGDTAH